MEAKRGGRGYHKATGTHFPEQAKEVDMYSMQAADSRDTLADTLYTYKILTLGSRVALPLVCGLLLESPILYPRGSSD